MAGRGDIGQVEPLRHPNIYMFRENKWLPAEEPLHTDKPDTAGIGLGMSFAVELLKEYPTARIGLLPCAVGGTPLSRWMPGTDLYENTLAITQKALNSGELKGILWHQGEGDSTDEGNSSTYAQRLAIMIAALREELDASRIPFLAGELGRFLQGHENYQYSTTVNRQLRDLVKTIPFYGCVSSAGLTDKGDKLHFDSASLREFGRRYAAQYLKIIHANGLQPLIVESEQVATVDADKPRPLSSGG